MKLLIVIVNYNCADLAIDCLRSLESQLLSIEQSHVVITDNKSPDNSLQKLSSALEKNNWTSWATLMPLELNGGFAYGNNAAIRPALTAADKPQYLLLLNPDTLVRPDAIKELITFMDANPAVGIAGPRLEDPDGTIQRSAFRFHSIAGEFEHGVRLGLISKLLTKKIVAPPPPSHAQPTDWISGAAMMIRREVFEQIGLLDEKYFMYFEEEDFCRRAAKAGWPSWYVPTARVMHLIGGVSEVGDARRHRKRLPGYYFESRRRYFVKNHGSIYATAADAAFLTGCALWRLRRLLQRKADTDPPKLLADSISHSVFLRGWAL
jgi:N-acetylglucosaminyl-diphospho-decaprenol L-rhamnosyltransferase